MNIIKKLGFDRTTLIRFIAVALCSQLIYSVDAMRNVVFNSYREMLGVSFAEIGFLYSLTGIVQLLAYGPAGWLVNRFSNRWLLLVNTLITALLSALLLFNVGYTTLVLIFCVFGVTKEAVFWTAVLRSVRCIAPDDKQATAFGALELVRGVVELVTNLIVVAAISWLGQSLFGIKAAVAINIVLMSVAAVVAWLVLPPDGITGANNCEKNKKASIGLLQAAKMRSVWLIGVNAGCVYVIYICLMYFAPFLQDVYKLPLSTIAFFALMNSSGVRMLSSPVGGLMGDTVFQSSAHLMRVFFLLLGLVTLVITAMPVEQTFAWPLMILFVIVSIACYMLRGVYFAPIGEMGVPHEMSGAAMSIASIIGYSPAFWTYWLIGWLIDEFPGKQGYSYVFMLMVVASAVGFASSCLLRDKMVKLEQEKQ
ncbi:MAG: MFS transporter [Negativicutes bacterium]